MSLIQVILLGLIQGVTEFLPISSSAHLVLASFVAGWRDQGLSFDIAAHLGTMVSVVIFFRHELAWLGRGLIPRGRAQAGGGISELADHLEARRMAWILLVATLPVGLVGWGFEDVFATVARQPVMVAAVSILFGLLLWWADRFSVFSTVAGVSELEVAATTEVSGTSGAGAVGELAGLTWRAGIVLGLFQALALFPGVSRSGITLTVALFLGFARGPAARVSFLMAVPVGVLVAGKQVADLARIGVNGVPPWALALVFVIAAVSSYLTIGWLLSWVRSQRLTVFVVYRVALGVLILFMAWAR